MSKTIEKKAGVNKKNTNEKLQNILSNISNGIGGTVVYFFLEDRFDKITDEPIQKKSVLHTTINPNIFKKEIKGKQYKRSYEEVLQILQDTCNDIGATYFRVE
jgi:GTP cyclohydrolase II